MAASGRELATARLRLRPFTERDLDHLARLYGDPRVMQIRKIGVQDRGQSAAQLTAIIAHWQRYGFGLWTVFTSSGGEFLGECGLRWRDDGSSVELSYGLVPACWGRGLATEASVAALGYGFTTAGLGRIVAIANAANAASHRVMVKLGMAHVETRGQPNGHRVVEYAIDQAAWQARTGIEEEEQGG